MSTPRVDTAAHGGAVALLAVVLKDRPNLIGARCSGRWDLWDRALWPEPTATAADTADARATVASLCAACPEQAHCPDAPNTTSEVKP